MRGSVVKRGRTWTYVLYLGRDESGHKRQKWTGGFRTRREAEAALTSALGRMQAGTWVDPGRQTLADYLEEWLASVKPSLAPATWASYELMLSKWVVPRVGKRQLATLTPAHLNKCYAELLESGGRDGAPLSPRSVRYAHTVVGRALRDAVEWGLLARNSARSAKPPKEQHREMATWSSEEVRQFLASVADDRLYPLWVLLVGAGLRRAEVAGLRWSDVDLAGGTLAVQHTRITVGYRVTESEPKTAKSRRSVALDPLTVAVLRQHQDRQGQERLAAGPAWTESGHVFVREDGQPYHPQRIAQLFQRATRHAGLPAIRLHDLRHTSATLALSAGVHPKVVQERLGHSYIGITLDTYSHVVQGMQAEAATRVAGLIFDDSDGGDKKSPGRRGRSARAS